MVVLHVLHSIFRSTVPNRKSFTVSKPDCLLLVTLTTDIFSISSSEYREKIVSSMSNSGKALIWALIMSSTTRFSCPVNVVVSSSAVGFLTTTLVERLSAGMRLGTSASGAAEALDGRVRIP